jgi:hypothetical protein
MVHNIFLHLHSLHIDISSTTEGCNKFLSQSRKKGIWTQDMPQHGRGFNCSACRSSCTIKRHFIKSISGQDADEGRTLLYITGSVEAICRKFRTGL